MEFASGDFSRGFGADDYIVKPFSPAELVARIKAHINRYKTLTNQNEQEKDVLVRDNIKLFKNTGEAFVGDKEITLTKKEFEVLYILATGWTNNAIVDGTSVAVKVDVETAGTLGEEILKQVEYVSNVNDLTISGVLNSDDFYQIQNRMPNLISIDMSAVKMEALPDYFFNTRTALLNIKLPENLKSIGNYAFHRCYGLTSTMGAS